MKNFHKILFGLGLIIIACGIAMRFYHITQNEFFFYDEGLYLNYDRYFLKIIDEYLFTDSLHILKAISVWFHASIATLKPLWFLLVDSRVFLGLSTAWYFSRVISAIAGILTLWATYCFAKKFYQSKHIAFASIVILAILPSHVFYSRSGFQESTTTLFFLLGFYFYLFPKTFGPRTFFSGLLFACAYFCNYRLIILPILIGCAEAFISFAEHKKPDARKYLWNVLTVCFCIVIVGQIDGDQNAIITFSWMFHQSSLAKEHFDVLNLLAYPYYVLCLEGGVFAILFWGNIYYIVKRQWQKLLPFFIAIIQMAIFSFSPDQGARYISIVLPFMAMGVAGLVVSSTEQKNIFRRVIAYCVCVFMIGALFVKSVQIIQSRSDYEPAMNYLAHINPDAKILSTQPYIENLYVKNKYNVEFCPNEVDYLFLEAYKNGFRYLVLDPQVYVSWTRNNVPFNTDLGYFLNFVNLHVQPLKTFPHLNRTMLERFVFEHSNNLYRSIVFLKSSNEHIGEIRIYDLAEAFKILSVAVGQQKQVHHKK